MRLESHYQHYVIAPRPKGVPTAGVSRAGRKGRRRGLRLRIARPPVIVPITREELVP